MIGLASNPSNNRTGKQAKPSQLFRVRKPSASAAEFVELDNVIWPVCPAFFAKIFFFAPGPNHLRILHRPVSLSEGRLAIVTDAGRDAVDADVPITNGA
jgi:hypothetical protein